MSKREKALARLRQNKKNVRFHELETILIGLGFEREVGNGSHNNFVLGTTIIPIPYRKPFLKPNYIVLALEAIDKIKELEADEDDPEGR